MLLMGFPFLLLSVNASIPMFAFVIVVFVLGEMLWVPTSQAIVARSAPEDVRGAYMGAFGSTAAVGFALGPFVGLQLRDGVGRHGDVDASSPPSRSPRPPSVRWRSSRRGGSRCRRRPRPRMSRPRP